MANQQTKATTISLFRNLLREVNRQFTPINKNTLWRDELFRAFRENQNVHERTKITSLIRDAEDVVTFLKSKRKHGELLKLYNPSIMRPNEKHIEMTANRVGLQMPNSYDEKTHQNLE
ncbi:11756_t:CDS:2 [Ambispora leptoticha]|uniref:11756_t:CDS:1 n=1 Tax=Ambispora leptoticha TaxID=144679 RepID=A0A9N8V9K9_9GLOM|nr:11756_t:CDS:2 [Ambispora leptoticha]